ncbi:MAG: hypothetical protein AAB473_03710 [Patescibacteria group bacterium]
MPKNEKPPERDNVLKFERPEGRINPPERPLIDPQNIPIGVNEPLDIRDERYRAGHRALRKKFDDAERAKTAVDEISGTTARDIETTMRETMILGVMQTTGHPREEVARNLDTQMLTERAQADLKEDEYVRLRELSSEETEAILEAAYAKAKEKYGHMYPDAAPTMFGHFIVPKIAPETPQPKDLNRTLIDRIRDRLKKVF